MKEITREDWLKNPTPRMMWVWDCDERDKIKQLVLHYFSAEDTRWHFVAVDDTNKTVSYWQHCAEIEEPKSRRMTNRELSWWLRDHPEEHREWRSIAGSFVHNELTYSDGDENEPCPDCILIRCNGGEWHEPLVEVEDEIPEF